MKACAARRGCGGNEDGSNWRHSSWGHAPVVARDLLQLLDHLTPTISELTKAIEQEAEKCPEAKRLMTHPGVRALTALAFILIIGDALAAASRWPAIWVWSRWKTRVGTGDG